MFNYSIGDITIKTVSSPKRGGCLEASNSQGERILMDYFGMNPMLVPDGTTAYLFGNSVIFLTRWSDMSDGEKKTVEQGELGFVIYPYEDVQFGIKVGSNWGNVFVNLHNSYNGLNDESKGVEKAIFIFSDTHDDEYLSCRSVTLPPFIAKYLAKCNINSHKRMNFDSIKSALEASAKSNPEKDFFDLLYDMDWDKTSAAGNSAAKIHPEEVEDGIYIDISSNNEVTNVYQGSDKPKEPQMSNEVKIYMDAAKRGIDEGQYNLGVCYETGDGIEQDAEKAVYWYRKAAEQGHAKAQYNLGICTYNGSGCEQDFEEAASLFLLSANQGDMYAQYSMGVCYYQGEGVEKNPFEAIAWFERSAKQGHPEAKRVLSMFGLG